VTWPTDYLNRVICGDCPGVLKTLPDQSVNCCITSPPYWGLRDYGVDGQLGLEKTPDEYVAHMVEVFREVRRVLRNDGTLWLNLGDSYAGGGRGGLGQCGVGSMEGGRYENGQRIGLPTGKLEGIKSKDLVGIPWMVAFALRADGWYLRQDIIWHKPNPMPESVTDRCTKAHEYIFLLSKQAKYYYDADAIAEPCRPSTIERLGQPNFDDQDGSDMVPGKTNGNMKACFGGRNKHAGYGTRIHSGNEDNGNYLERGANRRSVWTVTTKPFREAHFATFPPDLIEPCALAGCPESGVILDPFMGAGTTAVVAKQNYRNYIGIELNPAYIEMATKRIDGILVNRKLQFEARP
jgi:DNA modification methylase